MTHSPTKRARVISALLSGRSQAEAALDGSVARITVRRWLKDPEFQRELAAAQADLLSQIGRRLTSVTLKGIKGLETVLDDPKTSHANRVRAGRAAVALHLQLSRDLDRAKESEGHGFIVHIPMKLTSEEWATEAAKMRAIQEERANFAAEADEENEPE